MHTPKCRYRYRYSHLCRYRYWYRQKNSQPVPVPVPVRIQQVCTGTGKKKVFLVTVQYRYLYRHRYQYRYQSFKSGLPTPTPKGKVYFLEMCRVDKFVYRNQKNFYLALLSVWVLYEHCVVNTVYHTKFNITKFGNSFFLYGCLVIFKFYSVICKLMEDGMELRLILLMDPISVV